MNNEFARELIEMPGDAVTDRLFEGVDGVFWVDWREADDRIITLAAAAMKTPELVPVWIDEKLHVSFRGRMTEVVSESDTSNQDKTLRVLNKAIAPEFQIRFVKASDGGDTLAFMPLRQDEWTKLEEAFGGKVGDAFSAQEEGVSFFGKADEETMREMMRPMLYQVRFIRFSRVNFKVINRKDETDLYIDPKLGGSPVVESIAGDMALLYFRDLHPTYPVVTDTELDEYGLSYDELRETSFKNAHLAWAEKIKIVERGDWLEIVGGVTPNGVPMTASLILNDAFWGDVSDVLGEFVVAFPRQDMILCAELNDSGAVERLRDMASAMESDDPNFLSSLIYKRVDGRWSVFYG